ncbi:MAG TPA: helix-turn-helix transcriptional regulator [Polyangiaceae bacterium]|nr:helix-turn-helix transcriptional regulator [Polyangiaceae bacterium]
MKNARPPLALADLESDDALLTTGDVARLLRVHPKHVYRLLRRGLPGHRVGGEWRFLAAEVRRWSGARLPRASTEPGAAPDTEAPAPAPVQPPPLVAANGDVAVEYLLGRLTSEGRPLLGHVQADRGLGLELLKRGAVLAAGCHGNEIPGALDGERLAFIRLVDRQVGLALRRGVKLRSLRQIERWRLASRPPTAGVRPHLDGELRRHGVNPDALHARATVLPSHREVVCAVARGEADVGLASAAWANRVGLECVPLCRETYGLLVRASLLGDRRIVSLCEVAQGATFKKELESVCGYQARFAGAISFESIPAAGRSPGAAVP